MCLRAVKPKPFSELFSSKACPYLEAGCPSCHGKLAYTPGPLGTSTDFWMPVPAEPLVASSSQGSGMDERVDEAGLPSKLPTFAKHVRALCDRDHSEMQDLTWMKAPGLLVGHTRRVQLLWASGRLCAEQVDGEGS